MFFFKKKTPFEKELSAVLKKERKFLESRKNKKESFINRQLEKVVPAKLQSTLDSAFAKAFGLIFEKGTKVIEKTYNRKNLEIDFYENALLHYSGKLEAISPLKVLLRGYAIVEDENGLPIKSANAVNEGSNIKIKLHDGEFSCQVCSGN